MHTISLLDYNLCNAIVNVDAFKSIASEDRFLEKSSIEFNVRMYIIILKLFSKSIYLKQIKWKSNLILSY